MLDRLSIPDVVTLPIEHYSRAVILSDPSSWPFEIPSSVLGKVFASLKRGGKLVSEQQEWGREGGKERVDVLVSGFLVEEKEGRREFVKPREAQETAVMSIPLRRKKKEGEEVNGASAAATTIAQTPVAATNGTTAANKPNGVGFIDFSDDFGNDDDDELIDEDALLDDIDDLAIAIQQRKHISLPAYLVH